MCSAPACKHSQRVGHTHSQNPHRLFTFQSPLVASLIRKSNLARKNTHSNPFLRACMALSCPKSGASLEYDQVNSLVNNPISPCHLVPLPSLPARSLIALNCTSFASTHLRYSSRKSRSRTPSTCSCSKRTRT